MSWIVQALLIDRHKIRENIFDEIPEEDILIINFESEDYLNLIEVEKKVEEMLVEGLLTEDELNIINSIAEDRILSSLQNKLGYNRTTISKRFNEICDRIAFHLGGMFTDEGYITYMTEKHKLTEEQVEMITEHIRGKYRHMIRRKIPNG